ncbi:MAG: MBL fold metallo-hydrolase [Lachnospiraceae bacterium]
MKVTYISHSGFLIEMEKVNLLFDYFKGEIPKMEREKPLYVFSSHSHHDHFNPVIFDLAKEYDNIIYILSDDIKAPKGLDYILMSPYEEKCIENIKVKTMKSTDIGVAFLIEAEGKTIYHAGDLHWWHWIGEPDEDNVLMEKAYKKELELLKGKHIDIAFLVLDPRQEAAFDMGIDSFLRVMNVETVFPMHCWDDYSVIPSYKNSKKGEEFREKIVDITREGEIFLI